MRKHPKVTICVPVYNVEQYIERCARSLFEQTMKELEFIFVNDCTLDDSIKVLEKVIQDYPERKEQISILHHSENKKLYATRFTGVEAATGEYIIHVDSDDWCELDMCENMYYKAIKENADIVLADCFLEKKENTYIQYQEFFDNSEEMIKGYLDGSVFCPIWNRLVSRKLYNKIHYKYKDQTINNAEDVLINIFVSFFADRIIKDSNKYYHYNMSNINSITKNSKINNNLDKTINDYIKVINLIESFFIENNVLNRYKKSLYKQKIKRLVYFLLYTRGKKQKELLKLYPEVHTDIIINSEIFLVRRIGLLFAIYGFRIPVNMIGGAKRFITTHVFQKKQNSKYEKRKSNNSFFPLVIIWRRVRKNCVKFSKRIYKKRIYYRYYSCT